MVQSSSFGVHLCFEVGNPLQVYLLTNLAPKPRIFGRILSWLKAADTDLWVLTWWIIVRQPLWHVDVDSKTWCKFCILWVPKWSIISFVRLSGSNSKKVTLSWVQRLKIAVDPAKGTCLGPSFPILEILCHVAFKWKMLINYQFYIDMITWQIKLYSNSNL